MRSILYDKLTRIALVKLDRRKSYYDEESFSVIQYSKFTYGEYHTLETFTSFDWAKKGFYHYISRNSRY